MMDIYDCGTASDVRTVVWFSCGAASAVAAKLALREFYPCLVVYCDTMKSEHPDNARFFEDIQSWLGKPIIKVGSKRFTTVDEVFEKTGYMSGIRGARCTGELKRIPRFNFQLPDDRHIFGLTADEKQRADKFEENNHELDLDFILIRHNITKADCFRRLIQEGITLPVMYDLGYKNNNCVACVKATSAAYWRKIRHDFPEHFARRAAQSRKLGVRLTRVNGERVFIDELPMLDGQQILEPIEESISCGPDCGDKVET